MMRMEDKRTSPTSLSQQARVDLRPLSARRLWLPFLTPIPSQTPSPSLLYTCQSQTNSTTNTSTRKAHHSKSYSSRTCEAKSREIASTSTQRTSLRSARLSLQWWLQTSTRRKNPLGHSRRIGRVRRASLRVRPRKAQPASLSFFTLRIWARRL